MTSFDKWKLINEKEDSFASTTTRGLGGQTQAVRTGTGFSNLIQGDLPTVKKALATVDILASTLAQLEKKDRDMIINQIRSKLGITTDKLANSLNK